jgi:predicted ATPase
VNRERLSLPDFRTSFHGRTVEIAEIQQLLRRARLVTLVGAGGAGKTRLAIEVAARVAADFRDGVRLLDFTPVADKVPSAIAAGLGLQVARPNAILAQLADALATRHLLVILDNCEHVLEAIAEVANVVTRECPAVTVMATSRQPLALRSEVIYSVPPLAIETEAVPMFIERATTANRLFGVDPKEYGVVASVCRQLEGLPLAIELAAPLMRVMSAEELLPRLEEGLALPAAGHDARNGRLELPAATRAIAALVPAACRVHWIFHIRRSPGCGRVGPPASGESGGIAGRALRRLCGQREPISLRRHQVPHPGGPTGIWP